jgi:hypothetical protein
MWMLNFIPDAWLTLAVHLTTMVGAVGLVVGTVFSRVPLISQYAVPLRWISTLILCVGIYFQGSVRTELAWRERVAEMEQRIKDAEVKSAVVNTEIQTRVVTKIQVIKEKELVVQEKIREVEKIVDAKCEVAPEAIGILNQAAQDPTGGAR